MPFARRPLLPVQETVCDSRFWPIATYCAIAARVDDLIIRPGGVLRHREWGLYEVGICGPDGLLVRIGWPSRLMKTE
jgi:hypothetical protein